MTHLDYLGFRLRQHCQMSAYLSGKKENSEWINTYRRYGGPCGIVREPLRRSCLRCGWHGGLESRCVGLVYGADGMVVLRAAA